MEDRDTVTSDRDVYYYITEEENEREIRSLNTAKAAEDAPEQKVPHLGPKPPNSSIIRSIFKPKRFKLWCVES